MMIINSFLFSQDKRQNQYLTESEAKEALASDHLRAILIALYEFRYTNQGECNIHVLIEAGRLEPEAVWQAINFLEEADWVRMWNVEGKYTVTGIGAVNLERFSIAPRDIALRSQAARDWLINTLVDNYSSSHREDPIARSMLYNNEGMIDRDVDLAIGDCCDLGLIRLSANDIRLLQSGFRYHKDRELWREISDLFKQLYNCSTPQKRGIEFQRLFSRLIGMDKWTVEESAKSSNEEIDILVHREREDYLVECKWEQKPTEASQIREFQGKLYNRSGVRGIFASMSGFSQGAVRQVEEQLSQRELLLFGPNDLRMLFAREKSFEDMLTEKHRVMVRRKEGLWE